MRAWRKQRRQGFTLIEIMTALTIAALVIATVYGIAGSSARQFQEQSRIGQLQLGVRLAIDRLRRDVQRAGLHGTPDSNSPQELRCMDPARRVRAVVLANNADDAVLAAHSGWTAGSTGTDRLTLTGNFVTSDAYLVRGLNAAGNTLFLQTSWQGFRRSFVDPSDASGVTLDQTRFEEVFAPGRMLHIEALNGNHFFVQVQNRTLAGTDASVTFTPAIPIGGACSAGGLGEGALVSPQTSIQYRLVRDPGDMPPVSADSQAVTGPYTALVREELNPLTGNAIVDTLTTVLEWAVHFDVDVALDQSAPGAAAVNVQRFDDAAAAQRIGAAGTHSGAARSLLIEIGARTPEQDPRFPWTAGDDALRRFRVFDDRAGAARVRTAFAEISMPNLIQRGMRY